MMDCILHLAHQSEVHRMVLYHRLGHIFPEGFGEEAVELFPQTPKHGPCLLLLRGVAAAPAAVNAWLAASGLEWAVTRVYWLGGQPPAGSREQLVAQLMALGPPPGPCRLQCFPRSMELWLADQLLDAGFNLHPVAFEHVLHVVELPAPSSGGGPSGSSPSGGGGGSDKSNGAAQLHIRHCLLPAAGLFRNASARPSRVPGELSKAAGKLAEALMVADCCPMGGGQRDSAGSGSSGGGGGPGLSGSHSVRALGTVLDIGAAPGGWTAMLAQRAQRVVAIDPAELDPRLVGGTDGEGGDAGSGGRSGRAGGEVVHLRCKVEDAGPGIVAALGPGGLADCVVCDMNKHPDLTTPMVRAMAQHVRPGGLLVLTLKFFGTGRDRDAWQQRMEGLLAPEYEAVRVVWLLANTMYERTCLAVRSGGPAAAVAAASAAAADGV